MWLKTKFNTLSVFFLLLLSYSLFAQREMDKNRIFRQNSPDWVQTNGPAGGYINDIAIDPSNPLILYAAGSTEGIYKSLNGGDLWNLIEFVESGGSQNIEIDPNNPSILYCDHDNLSKSINGALSWQNITNGFGNIAHVQVFKIDPINSDILYMAGNRFDGSGVVVFKSDNGGQNWQDITGNLNTPVGSGASALGVMGNGKIFVGINDWQLQTWHKGKVFYSSDDGQTWNEVNFGQHEDRFIWSIFVNTFNLQEVWISEGPIYNNWIPQPLLYKSSDEGNTWDPININVVFDNTQVRVIGVGSDGKVYISGGGNLFYTFDGGNSFFSIDPPSNQMTFVDFSNIAVILNNPNELFLPLRAGGIAYSSDGGINWALNNNGILSTSINLLASDPFDPSIIYATSSAGNGTFRSDDYGQNWIRLNAGGIVHPWSDELTVDPIDQNNVWFISDVPYIHQSNDRGNTWTVLHNPYNAGDFNFCSIYSMAQSLNNNILYASNNGFGIFKGQRTWPGEPWHWNFLNLSEIDYTYTLATEPNNSDVIYSGYNRKPFETKSKIRASYDGGDTWFTSLEVDGAEAITSVVIDPMNVDDIYAASTGGVGGATWISHNKGQNWQKLNDYFNFTTIHSFAVAPGNSSIAFAGVWGGGTYKTNNFGESWDKLESDKTISAAAIAIDPNNANIVYVADRTEPVLYKSFDGGNSWSPFFNAGFEYRRLMSITIDPTDSDRLYVSAMKIGGPGELGGLFKIESGIPTDITGTLPKVVLNLTVDPNNSSKLYTVLHESGVYQSTDGGINWLEISGTASGLPESGFFNIYIDPNNSNVLYIIGGCDVRFATFQSAGLDPDSVNGVYRSSDAGQTWENINQNVLGAQSGAIKSLVFYNNSSNTIYVGSENGVYYSTDSGSSWQFSPDLPYNTLGGIAVSGNTIYAFTNGAGLYKGSINPDFSIAWDVNQKIIADIHFAQIIKDPINSSIIYASGYPGGVFKSLDGGATWHEKNFGMVSFEVEDPLRQGYYALDICESNPDVLYLGLYEKGVYRSRNGADTWYPINGQNWEMMTKKITSIAVNPNDENVTYVGAEDGVYQTNNGGVNWFAINAGLSTTDIRVLHLNYSGELYAGTRGYSLFKWGNGIWEPQTPFGEWGVIWPIWNDRPLYQYTSLLIHPQDNSQMLIGTFPQGIYKSTDGGTSWKEKNVGWTMDGVFRLVCHPLNPEIVYAGTYNGINRSLDFGEHWELWDNGWPPEQWVFSIDFNPTDSNIMYACSKNGENEGTGVPDFRGTVMKSLDGGANWFEIINGLDKDQEFYKIIVDKFDANTIYLAAQHDGIFKSEDAGNSWTPWNEGLTNHTPGTNGNNVTNTLVLSADHSILYFGTAGSGVFRRMISPILPVNNLSAKVKNHQIILNWQFDDLNNNFHHYNVYKSTTYFSSISGMTPYASIFSVSDTTFNDSNYNVGDQYFYTVTTVDVSFYENDHIFVIGPIVDNGISITTTMLDSGIVGISYNDTLQAIGGSPPYYWEIIQGILPAGLSLVDSTGIIWGIPDSSGNFDFTLKVIDSHPQPYQTVDSLKIVIIEIGIAPVLLNPIPDVNFPEDSGEHLVAVLDTVFFDPNTNDSLSFSVSSDNLNIQVMLQEDSLIISSSPDYFGNGNVKITATDTSNLSVSDTFLVTITSVNDPPIIHSIPPIIFPEDSSYSFDFDTLVHDVDHDTTEISWLASFPENTLASIVEQISKKPKRHQLKNISRITRLDKMENDPSQLEIVSRKLKKSAGKKIRAKSVLKTSSSLKGNLTKSLFSGSISALGIIYGENDSLFIEIDSVSHIATITATPNFYGLDIPVIFTAVDDSGASDSDTTTISVQSVNDPPIISQLPELTFNEDDTLTYALSNWFPFVDDPDTPDSELSYLVISGQNIVAEPGNAVYFFHAPQNWFGRDTLQLVVSDSALSDTADLYVNVNSINDPQEYVLMQNYPNPFNPVTHIRFGLPKPSEVKLEIYNILGQRVTMLVNHRMNAGYHLVDFDASNLSSGLYFYRIQADKFQQVRKILLMK